MRGRLLLAASIVVTVSGMLCAAPEPRDILMREGLMEYASASPLPDGWGLVEPASFPYTVELDRSVKVQGQSSLKFSCRDVPAGSKWHIRNVVLVGTNGVKIGDTLVLHAKVRTGVMQNARLTMSLQASRQDGVVLVQDARTYRDADLEWFNCELSIRVPEGAHRVSAGISLTISGGMGNATLWVDDMRVSNGEVLEVPVRTNRTVRTFTVFRMHPDVYETARRYDVVIVTGHSWRFARPLRYYNPNIVVYIYFNAPATASNFPGDYDALDYQYVLNQRPHWFLTDSQGNRLVEPQYPNSYLVDIGDTELQQRWATRAVDIAQRYGFNGVYIDNMVHNYISAFNPKPARYPTEEMYRAAQTAFIQAVSPVIRQAGLKVMANFGYIWTQSTPPYSEWLRHVDAALAENWVRFYSRGEYQFHSVPYQLTHIQALRQHGNIQCLVQGRATEAEKDIRRYLFGCALLNYDGYTHFHTSPGDYSERAHYLPDYELALGAPLDEMRLVAGDLNTGGVFRRVFSNGLVLVNMHDTQTFSINLDTPYIDADGVFYEPGNRQLPPRSALILAKANDALRLEVTLSRQQPIPGEEVTVTVRITNRSQETVQHVRVNVPIPAPMQYVAGSADAGGVFDQMARTVTWHIFALPPGASLTRTFRARIP